VTAVPPPRMPPPAWTLRPSDPRLCPGTNQPCCINEPYRRTYCPHCGTRTGVENTPSIPGGGRVAHHYPPDGPRPVGQLDLFEEETTRA
jgi:hypothetical protein